MQPSSRRPMDWVSAWGAALPVYGLAVVLHAIFPLFAVPIWAIFYVYARKVLDGARMAEDPWRGRGTPRAYLSSWTLAIVAHFGALGFAPLVGTPSLAVTGIVAGVAALTLAALFMAGAAPPGIRDARGWMRLGVGAEILAALAAAGLLFGALPSLALAGLSVAGFSLARRRASRAAPILARKVPRE